LLALVFGRRELEQARIRLADVEARREQEQLATREQLALIEQSRTVLSREFEVLANRIFESKQASFESISTVCKHMQQQSKQSLEGLVIAAA
jgi:DNA anti-recombination protein RmuC